MLTVQLIWKAMQGLTSICKSTFFFLTQVQCGKTEDLQSPQLYGQRTKFTISDLVSILKAKTDTTKQAYRDHKHNQQQKAGLLHT